MRTFNHVLFFACLALLGVVAVIEGLGAPLLPVRQQTQAASGPHNVAVSRVRPMVGRPLQEAIALFQQGNYREAMQRVDGVDALPGKNAQEQQAIDQMRAAITARLQGKPHPI